MDKVENVYLDKKPLNVFQGDKGTNPYITEKEVVSAKKNSSGRTKKGRRGKK